MTSTLKLGVLCLHGAFAEHVNSLRRAVDELKNQKDDLVGEFTVEVMEVRRKEHLDGLSGLILPGGESTVMAVFLAKDGFGKRLKEWVHDVKKEGTFTWGTCAGLILLANKLEQSRPGGQLTIGGLDVTVSRNIQKGQRSCYIGDVELQNKDIAKTHNTFFINPPLITHIASEEVEVLATEINGESSRPVGVKQRNLMATSFHPELTQDSCFHRYFIKQAARRKKGF